jgi:hypothetical protein
MYPIEQRCNFSELLIRIRDPVLFDIWLDDLGGKKIHVWDPGSGINIPDHISGSLV